LQLAKEKKVLLKTVVAKSAANQGFWRIANIISKFSILDCFYGMMMVRGGDDEENFIW
jgi:hypothetical protein